MYICILIVIHVCIIIIAACLIKAIHTYLCIHSYNYAYRYLAASCAVTVWTSSHQPGLQGLKILQQCIVVELHGIFLHSWPLWCLLSSACQSHALYVRWYGMCAAETREGKNNIKQYSEALLVVKKLYYPICARICARSSVKRLGSVLLLCINFYYVLYVYVGPKPPVLYFAGHKPPVAKSCSYNALYVLFQFFASACAQPHEVIFWHCRTAEGLTDTFLKF